MIAASADFRYALDMMKPVVRTILGLALLLAVGLSAQEAPKPKPVAFKVSVQSFLKPAKWVAQKTASRMRAAQFGVLGKDGKVAGECVFFYFGPGQGGGAAANLQRWVKQFASAPKPKTKVEEVKLGETPVAYLFVQGTFMKGPPFGGAKVPHKDYGMAAAVLGTKPGYIFVKLTGPKAVVDGAKADFKKMIESGLKGKKKE